MYVRIKIVAKLHRIDDRHIHHQENEFVYKSRYDGLFTKNDFLFRFAQNKQISTIPNDNSVWIEFECAEFQSIDSLIINLIEQEIIGSKFDYYAKHSWVYTQKKRF